MKKTDFLPDDKSGKFTEAVEMNNEPKKRIVRVFVEAIIRVNTDFTTNDIVIAEFDEINDIALLKTKRFEVIDYLKTEFIQDIGG